MDDSNSFQSVWNQIQQDRNSMPISPVMWVDRYYNIACVSLASCLQANAKAYLHNYLRGNGQQHYLHIHHSTDVLKPA